ncbi:MAG: adenylate/guanylate cyclase domain-containing protein [Mycobacteriaceae bacterium]|nr:adenylate/guanylate cyclase domain-containing protein [Mycobacteriaceae bacterium]MBV9641171.1 adenylate/guanylate cyclase domain-containing protein [Mycobacteriaceae bacterium]
MTVDADIEASGLLYGLEGKARQERAELIAWLLDRGFTMEQIRKSRAAPMLLPSYRVLGDDGTYVSARQICESTGIELDLLQRLQRAAGLPRIENPDAAVLPKADVEAAARAKYFLDFGAEPDDAVAVVRVLADGLRRTAATMREAGFKTWVKPGASETELAAAAEEMARRAAPQLGPMVEAMLMLQLRHTFETDWVSAAELSAGRLPGARVVAVAFADLTGFTRLGEALSPEELERVASHFAKIAHEVEVGPVRFVKTIGDAVMFVCPESVLLVKAILDLVNLAAQEGLPRLRAGVAAGEAVSRAGDWFGKPVNVASRITAVARPGTVLVAESARDTIGSAFFEWTPVGTRHLKGVRGEVKLFQVCRSLSYAPTN